MLKAVFHAGVVEAHVFMSSAPVDKVVYPSGQGVADVLLVGQNDPTGHKVGVGDPEGQ